jgi:hypothetical protein
LKRRSWTCAYELWSGSERVRVLSMDSIALHERMSVGSRMMVFGSRVSSRWCCIITIGSGVLHTCTTSYGSEPSRSCCLNGIYSASCIKRHRDVHAESREQDSVQLCSEVYGFESLEWRDLDDLTTSLSYPGGTNLKWPWHGQYRASQHRRPCERNRLVDFGAPPSVQIAGLLTSSPQSVSVRPTTRIAVQAARAHLWSSCPP